MRTPPSIKPDTQFTFLITRDAHQEPFGKKRFRVASCMMRMRGILDEHERLFH